MTEKGFLPFLPRFLPPSEMLAIIYNNRERDNNYKNGIN
jgi:hypothetical protein